jgi:hypothetical protein
LAISGLTIAEVLSRPPDRGCERVDCPLPPINSSKLGRRYACNGAGHLFPNSHSWNFTYERNCKIYLPDMRESLHALASEKVLFGTLFSYRQKTSL